MATLKALTKAQIRSVATRSKLSLPALFVLETKQELDENLPWMWELHQPYFIWKDSSAWSADSVIPHWVAVFIENETKTAFGFNPVGLPLDKTVLDALKMYPNMVERVVWNALPVQAADHPETWGHWCLYYLMAMTTSAGMEDGYKPAEEAHNAFVDTLHASLMRAPPVSSFGNNETYLQEWWKFLDWTEE